MHMKVWRHHWVLMDLFMMMIELLRFPQQVTSRSCNKLQQNKCLFVWLTHMFPIAAVADFNPLMFFLNIIQMRMMMAKLTLSHCWRKAGCFSFSFFARSVSDLHAHFLCNILGHTALSVFWWCGLWPSHLDVLVFQLQWCHFLSVF